MPSGCARECANAGRPRDRLASPICPEALSKNIVKLNVWELEVLFRGVSRALAKTGVFGAQVTGMADGSDVETTARSAGCGQVTRKVRICGQTGPDACDRGQRLWLERVLGNRCGD
jgi:hypothetical protein